MNTYYTIYETTNLLNHMKYRGAHKTANPNDSYLGSGDHLKHAVKKYGKCHFSKEILFFAFDEESMIWAEKIFVDKDWVERKDIYNLTEGGKKSSYPSHQKQADKIRGIPKSEEHRKKLSESHKGQIPWIKGKKLTFTEDHRKNIGISTLGRRHSEETKLRLSAAFKDSVSAFDLYSNQFVRVSKEEYYQFRNQRYFGTRSVQAKNSLSIDSSNSSLPHGA